MMNYEYDVAISYKSEIEAKAAKINDYLTEEGLNVFFAPARQQEMLSEKIHQMLYGVYKNQSLMKVLLISESYLDGEWTALEKRVSLESTKEDRKRLLIVNYTDQIILPGDLKDLQYMDGRALQEDKVASLVTERIHKFLRKNAKGEREKEIKEEFTGEKRSAVKKVIIHNKGGIVAGDNAHFGNIQL